jgi:hypothetical protein
MHWPYKMVLYDHTVKYYLFVMSYQESRWYDGKYIVVIDWIYIKLFYSINTFFFSYICVNFFLVQNIFYITSYYTFCLDNDKNLK